MHKWVGTTLRLVGLAGAIAPLLISACAAPPSGARETGAGAGGGTAPKTLRVGMQVSNHPSGGTDGPMSPAPYGGSGSGSAALEHYFTFHGNLTMFDETNAIVPLIAQKVPTLQDGDWRLTPSGMEVTWKIRPNVFWHDGAPLTAEDFVFALEVFRDPELAHASRGEVASIAELRALDSSTLLAVWKTQSIVGNSNPHDGFPVIPRHIFEPLYRTGDKTAFENSPLWNVQWVGLGPYRMVRWELGSFIEATAFDQYFRGRPKIDRVVIQYIGDHNALIAAVLSGDIDVIPLGAQLDLPQMVTVRDAWGPQGGLTMAVPKGVRTIYLQFRDASNPWVQDLRVRQALIHALDRDTFVETLLYGLTQRADFFEHPQDPAYRLAEQRLTKYPFDPSRTERLMAEAGWTRGPDRLYRNSAGQPVHIDVTASAQGANVQEAQTVAANWSQAGFQSAPTPYPPAAENASEIRHNIQGALIWPYNFGLTVAQTFTTDQIGTPNNRWRGGNYGGYVNRQYEDLYQKLTNTFDTNERTDLKFQLLKILNEDLPALPIFFTPLSLVARANVQGPGMTSAMQAANAWNIHTWELK